MSLLCNSTLPRISLNLFHYTRNSFKVQYILTINRIAIIVIIEPVNLHPMIRKPVEKQKAIQLRQKGKSVKDIATLLGVSSSTVSLWVRHILLSPVQRQLLIDKVFQTLQKGRIKAQAIQKELRKAHKYRLDKEALTELGSLSDRDLFIAGIILYWAEGFKKDNRLGFANSDPVMIKVFLRWLASQGVPNDQIRLRVGLNISHKGRIAEVEKFWSQQTKIPLHQFQKAFFQKFKWKKEFPRPEEYFGVIRIRANNQGNLFLKTQTWIKAVRELYT